MIVFKNIKYKNFLSTGNTPIDIDLNKSHTTLIVGQNGSGKSTLLDALCFVLFNKPFRIIKKEQIVNSINNTETIVEITFDVGTKEFKIIRGIKPNIFEIYCDGELLNQDANSIDYQKYLEQNIMRLNYRSFLQVVLLGSSSYEPFMKMKPRYRREVVEEILDIRVFGLMDLILRSQQSDLAKKVIEMRHRCDLIQTKYETELNHFNAISDLNMNDLDGKKQLIDQNKQDNNTYSKKIEELNEKIGYHKEEVAEKGKVEKKVNQLSKLEAKIETNLSTHQKSLEFFENNDNCPTCTQPIDHEFKGNKIEATKQKIKTLQEGMNELLTEITNTEIKLTEMNKVSQKINELNIDISKFETSLDEINKFSNRIHEEIKLLENKQVDGKEIKQHLEQLNLDLEEGKIERDRIIEQKSYVDILRTILNDKGAKAQIIRKYVPIMNNLINQHLQAMDFFVSFHLDEEFNETIKSRFRDGFNYNNFSEGEKMRIDLALLFTWRHIAKMKNSTNTNLLILDEIFDGSLDGQGTDDFFKIITQLSKENIFIISHKGDIMFDKFTNIIKFEKYKNFTRLQQA
jgi:DNA repair exonuclease SbcCD ATPase subunit|tara:strand:+ start:685 stop:2400 length:1716 start_codon:yes stop_codon:yes gene_type:complete